MSNLKLDFQMHVILVLELQSHNKPILESNTISSERYCKEIVCERLTRIIIFLSVIYNKHKVVV